MARAKVAITVDDKTLAEVRLAREAAKLDVREEQALADKRYAAEAEWAEY